MGREYLERTPFRRGTEVLIRLEREDNRRRRLLSDEEEAALLLAGVPLAQVRDLLGHASILTTERYDSQSLEALQAAAARLEAGKAFDTITHGVAGVSSSFQVPAEDTPADSGTLAAKSARSD